MRIKIRIDQEIKRGETDNSEVKERTAGIEERRRRKKTGS